MNVEEVIQRIIDNGRVEDMHSLSNILEDNLKTLKEYYPEKYKEYEMELYKMAYGCVLNREMAEEIVNKMQPYGKKWDLQQTQDLQNQYGINDINEYDFYVVINSAYNDYNDLFNENIDEYIRFTIDFIQDEDAKQGKVFTYFTTIPR